MLIISKFSNNKIPFVSGFVFSHFVKIQDDEYYCFLHEQDYKNKFANIPGQINESTEFGSLLTIFASKYRLWVEIGTWNGLGSTKCILNGFQKSLSENPILYSFELDPMMFNVAKENLKDNIAFNCVTFINNKLHSETPLKFPTENELPVEEKEYLHFKLYYEREKILWNLAPGYKLPFSPEAVLLDGGEYSGYLDWLSLDKTNLKVIFLDDINCFKNKLVLQELKNNPEWKSIKISTDRNGFAVFIKN
jgi:hypothetical protein